MSLTISNTIIDEELRATQTGTADDNDVSLATYNASAFKTAVTALGLNFPATPPTGFPQHAEKQDFVTSSNEPVVTNYFLASSSDGDAFPTSGDGIETDLFVGSNQIFLYGTANSDIIVGRLGTGTTPNDAGAVVLVIGIEETTSGGFVTQADMWLSIYAPLVHGDLNQVDSADTLNLADLVYLGSAFDTTTNIPFENFDGVPSGNNLFNVIFPSDVTAGDVQLLLTGSTGETLSTVNVSTTGVGAGSQHIDVGYTLRIDTVSGMVKENVNQAPEVNNSANIDYTARVELSGADFEITQLNPGSTPERADLKISAFNAAGTSQEAAYLTNAIASDGVPVDIDPEDVIVLNGAGQNITASLTIIQDPNDANSVIIRGLDDGANADKTDGYQVFFTTDGVKFDRFLITNVDSSTTFDVGNIHVTAVTGGADEEFAEVGSKLIYQDDGPNIDPSGNTAPTITDDESAFGTNNSASFAGLFTSPDYGADTPGTVSYTLGVKSLNVDSGLDDTLSGQNVVLSYDSATNTVFGKTASSNLEVFRITVASNGTVTLDQSRAVKHSDTTSFDESTTAMVADLITLTAKIVDSEGATTGDSDTATVNIAASFIFKDDGPGLTPQAGDSATPNNLQVDNDLGDAGDSSDSSSYGLVPGADGQQGYTIIGGPDTTGDFRWAYTNADHTAIKGTVADEDGVFHDLYTLALNTTTGGYTFTMIGTLPGSEIDLDVNDIKAGGPDTNSIIVGGLDDPRSIQIAASGGPINESNDNVGVTNGNLDTGESLTFVLLAADGTTHLSFQGLSIGTKTAQGGTYHWVATTADGSPATLSGDVMVAKNLPIVIDPDDLGGELITSITITKASGSTTKIGLDDISIFVPPNDVQLGFTVELKDGDNDATTQNFTVDIDGNNDGVFSATVNSLSLPLENSTLSAIETLHHHELASLHDGFAV